MNSFKFVKSKINDSTCFLNNKLQRYFLANLKLFVHVTSSSVAKVPQNLRNLFNVECAVSTILILVAGHDGCFIPDSND